MLLDAQCIDLHWFRPHIQDQIKGEKIWVSDKEQLHGILEPQNFEPTLKMLMNQYHEFVLTRGDFDERIFLNPEADKEVGTPVKGGANFAIQPAKELTNKNSGSKSMVRNPKFALFKLTNHKTMIYSKII